MFKLGDIVLVPLDDADRTKMDGGNHFGVIVTINKDISTCRVEVKQRLLCWVTWENVTIEGRRMDQKEYLSSTCMCQLET